MIPFDIKGYLARRGVAYYEITARQETALQDVIECRTSEASVSAIGFSQIGKQLIFMDQNHLLFLRLIGSLLDIEKSEPTNTFEHLPTDEVIHELALIRLAGRALNTRCGNLSLCCGILNRPTALPAGVLAEYRSLAGSRFDLASKPERVSLSVIPGFVCLHELAHLDIQRGSYSKEAPEFQEMVHAISVISRLIDAKAEEAIAAGKMSYMRDIRDHKNAVITSKVLNEEVRADFYAFQTSWVGFERALDKTAYKLLPIIFDGVFKTIAAASILGIYDNALVTLDPARLGELSTTYLSLALTRLEFLIGFFLVLITQGHEAGKVDENLFNTTQEAAKKLRVRLFHILNREFDFITLYGGIGDLHEYGVELRSKCLSGDDAETRSSCARSLGWMPVGDHVSNQWDAKIRSKS